MEHPASVDVDGSETRTRDLLPLVTRDYGCHVFVTHRPVAVVLDGIDDRLRVLPIDVAERPCPAVDVAEIDDHLEDATVFVVEMPATDRLVLAALGANELTLYFDAEIARWQAEMILSQVEKARSQPVCEDRHVFVPLGQLRLDAR